MGMRCLSVVTLFVILFTGLGCSGKNSKRERYLQQMKQDQGKYEKLAKGQEVDGERTGEAKNFLEFTNTQNVLPITGKRETLALVNDLYDAGSPRVMCLYVVREATFKANMCSSLLIEMPKDQAQRKEVLKAFTTIEKNYWKGKFNPVADEGQKYLYLNMEP